MRTSTFAALAASVALVAEPRAQAQPAVDSSPEVLREVNTVAREQPLLSPWQKNFGSASAYPDAEWIAEKRAAIRADANWNEVSDAKHCAFALGLSAKSELLAVLAAPNASRSAVTGAAQSLLASGDHTAVKEVLECGLRPEVPLLNRQLIFAALCEAGDPRALRLAGDLLQIAGRFYSSAKTDEQKANAIGLAKLTLSSLSMLATSDARDGLLRMASAAGFPEQVRYQAAITLAGRPDLSDAQVHFLHGVCENEGQPCPPVVAVAIASELAGGFRVADHADLLLRVLKKNIGDLPPDFDSTRLCKALEHTGGSEALEFLRQLAASQKVQIAATAIETLGRCGRGSQVNFLMELAAAEKQPLQIRMMAADKALFADLEQSNFNLSNERIAFWKAQIERATLHAEVRATIANGLMNAYILRSERARASGSDQSVAIAQEELAVLPTIKTERFSMPAELLLARQVRHGVPGSLERAEVCVLNPGVSTDWRATIFRGVCAAAPERAASLLNALSEQVSSGQFNFSPFLTGVERSDPNIFVPALERISRSGSAQATPAQLKAIELIALAASRESSEALARISEDAAVPFTIRTRALWGLCGIDASAGAPIAEKFAASEIWSLKDAGEVCLAFTGDEGAAKKVAQRFAVVSISPSLSEPVEYLSVSMRAQALAASGQAEVWSVLWPSVGEVERNRDFAIKRGIENALRAPQRREAFISGLSEFLEKQSKPELLEYVPALARCAALHIEHPLRYSPTSLCKIVSARDQVTTLKGDISLLLVSRGDVNGGLYNAAALVSQLHANSSGAVLVYEISNEAELEQAAVEAGQFVDGVAQRPVQTLVPVMHGSKLRASLGGQDPRSGVIFDERSEIDVSDVQKMSRYRSLLAEGGRVFWIACCAAEPGDEQHPQSLMTESRTLFPQARPQGIIALEVPADFRTVRLTFDEQRRPIDMDMGARKRVY
ncbi:MAG: hypothetical protein J0M12_10940 [Deltaproteobacteria bacterium]|nr:hypothetical protein [Deltaproteobacteria bacterium]